MAKAAELVTVMEKEKTAKEEPAVTSKTFSDILYEQCCNVLLLCLSVQYIGTMYVLLKDCDGIWMSVGLIALVTPCFGSMLYTALYFKGKHTEKYTMAHRDAQVAVPDKAPAAENV